MKKFVFALIAFVSLSAFAQTKQDGNEMLEHMKTNNPSFTNGFVYGYIRGVTDNMPCIPSEVTNGQRYEIVKNYLEQNPETRHEYQGRLVTKALNKAYPCKKTAPKG